MKTLRMFRMLDSRGRITIPSEIRKVLKVEQGSEIEIFIENEIVCLRDRNVTQTPKPSEPMKQAAE